ncbi:MAG TPA: DinB family protein [Balneolaceae bacterium]|nr:DinB family protein [Balneolaceae bacterium]
MEPSKQLLRLFSYDNWANEQILLSLQENPNFQGFDKAIGYFAHIAATQEHWYNRIEGISAGKLKIWPDYDLAQSFQILKDYSERWIELIDANREDPDRIISYKNSKGTPYETMLSDILHHLIIHGQHHRAQIAKLLRNAKITPPATDFIYFSRSN